MLAACVQPMHLGIHFFGGVSRQKGLMTIDGD